ncbi:MAG: hypothetical protein JSS09_02830 [Verrucomicrobia bacterium]|nr:hypothetical protein [Verrucomicrobiota bacterium]
MGYYLKDSFDVSIFYAGLGVFSIWLFNVAKSNPTYKTIGSILIFYIMERSFTIGFFSFSENFSTTIIQAFICIPIIIFLIKGVICSVENELIKGEKNV